jgi:hypothetical protein
MFTEWPQMAILEKAMGETHVTHTIKSLKSISWRGENGHIIPPESQIPCGKLPRDSQSTNPPHLFEATTQPSVSQYHSSECHAKS